MIWIVIIGLALLTVAGWIYITFRENDKRLEALNKAAEEKDER